MHEWLSNSNFSDYGDRSSTSDSPPKACPAFYATHAQETARDDASSSVDAADLMVTKPSTVTVLQRKMRSKNGMVDSIPSRTYRRKSDSLNIMVYENKSGGLTKKAKGVLEKILFELKSTELAVLLSECVMVIIC